MAEEMDARVAARLLDEVEEGIQQQLGERVAKPFGSDYDADLDFFAREMIKQCDLAESKSGGDRSTLARSAFLKGRLYGFWYQQGPMAYRAGHKRAADAYQRALELGHDETTTRYYLAILYGAGLSKEKAVQNFERVIELAGENSERGLDSATKVAKIKAAKGACFIATAALGDPDTSEIATLSAFRDDVLARSRLGARFITTYYRVSPSIATFVSRSRFRQAVVRYGFVVPITKMIGRIRRSTRHMR